MQTAIAEAHLGKGFDDLVLGAQDCFRAILSAMSEPGTVCRLDQVVEPPPGIAAAAALVLLTMVDQETRVWLSPDVMTMAPFVRFHCSGPVVPDPKAAEFALLDGAEQQPLLSAFEAGDERYPDRSTTVVVQCSGLAGGSPVTLAGPGIRETRTIAPAGLRPGFWDEVAANNDRYPLGVDIILASGIELMAIPRSTRITLPMEPR